MSAGLSFTAYYTRKILKWGVVGIFVYTIIHVSIVAGWRAWQNRTSEPPPPTAAFGVIPSINFPEQDPGLAFNFRLETISGELPQTFPDRANVFVTNNYQPTFFAYNDATTKAARLGFVQEPIPVTESKYRWRQLEGLTGLLELHIFRGDFDMILDWASNDATLVSLNKGGANELSAFRAAQQVIINAGSWTAEWPAGSYATIYYEYVNGQLVEVDRLTKADFLHVNLRPQALAPDVGWVSADPKRPAVWALVARRNGQVVEMHFRFYGIDRAQFADYPLEPIETIWQRVLDNDIYIANIGQNQPGEEVIIRYFELAYFLPTEYTDYIQPVYVIKGDKGFEGYIPAVNRQLLAQ